MHEPRHRGVDVHAAEVLGSGHLAGGRRHDRRARHAGKRGGRHHDEVSQGCDERRLTEAVAEQGGNGGNLRRHQARLIEERLGEGTGESGPHLFLNAASRAFLEPDEGAAVRDRLMPQAPKLPLCVDAA